MSLTSSIIMSLFKMFVVELEWGCGFACSMWKQALINNIIRSNFWEGYSDLGFEVAKISGTKHLINYHPKRTYRAVWSTTQEPMSTQGHTFLSTDNKSPSLFEQWLFSANRKLAWFFGVNRKRLFVEQSKKYWGTFTRFYTKNYEFPRKIAPFLA